MDTNRIKMQNILIFKTDKLGDLVNISPVISNLKKNFPDCNISLICSNYNYPLAKYYFKDLNIMLYKGSFIYFFYTNFKTLINIRYDLILQLDGKKHSYLLSIFVRSKFKACLRFIKNKSIFGIDFSTCRPGFFIKYFFNICEDSVENYNILQNKNYHYLSLYLKLLNQLNIKIFNKDHYLPYDSNKSTSVFTGPYFLFHIDQKWELFDKKIHDNLKKKIILLSKNNNIVISSNIGGNKLFNHLASELFGNSNIKTFSDANLSDILSLIHDSHTCVSSHSGLVVHIAAAFKKKIVDIVPESVFNQHDRWIPYNINYTRYNINDFSNL
tara:strand:+ start:1146 stop:2126 length:981 start_codon:yes stop_codon:yes gene_type:complete